MSKIPFVLLLFFILSYSINTVYSQFSDQHRVVILVQDSLGNVIADTHFEILNLDNTIHSRGKSNSEGIFELNLNKNRSYKIKFTDFENEHIYNFTVPKEMVLKEFRLICRLPVEVAKRSSTEHNEKITGNERIIPVTISIQSKDFKKIPNQSFTLISQDKSFNQKLKTDQDGNFTIDLIEKNRYSIRTTYNNFEYSDNFIVPIGAKSYTFKLILPVTISSTDIPTQSSAGKYLEIFTLENVTFETASWELKPESFSYLDSLVERLKRKPTMEIEIAGHTDDIGSDEDNLILSQRRAETVYNYLTSKGIEPERITPIGYGEHYPLATNRTPEGRAKNRRIEIRVIRE